MKSVSIGALSLLLILFLTGCLFHQDDPSQSKPARPAPSEETKTSENTDRPTDEQVLAAYDQATEAMGWFDLTTMPLFSDSGVEMEYAPSQGDPYPVTYYPVNHPAIGTTQELWDYLGTLFSPEIVARLQSQSQDRYRDIDGVLYAFTVDRGTDVERGNATYKVLEQDNGLVVQATVELLTYDENQDEYVPSGQEILNFPYRQVDGRWVFTDFELIW